MLFLMQNAGIMTNGYKMILLADLPIVKLKSVLGILARV